MFFVQLLKSLDDLLYELMSWLVFYPVTLWRTLRHPWGMMDYAATELRDGEHHKYSETLSPPLFLLVTLLLGHAIELALIGDSVLLQNKRGLASLVKDDTSLLMLRLVVFSVFAMILATWLVVLQRRKLTRETLRRPFYAQCYPTGTFALMIGMGGVATQLHFVWMQLAGLVLMLVALLWYGFLQARWFARTLKVSWLKGFWHASVGMVLCVGTILIAAPLLA